VGDFAVQAPVESKDEIGRLAGVFNTMTDQLRSFIGLLEAQVRERTNDLALSMEIGQQASAIRELEPLLKTVVSFLDENFKLDAVQVYLMDDLSQNLIVAETSQNVELSSLKHIVIGDASAPGQAAATALPELVPDTQQRQTYVPLPSLPDTRSHLAVPLLVEQHVIGVLDLHANTPKAFTQENLTVFEAVATQLAISIDSARQWALSLEAQTKTEQALRQLTQQQWAETLVARREALGYAYNLSTITPTKSAATGDVQVPLTIQNQQVGKLSVSAPPGRKFSEDEQELLASVAQQLAQKAENLRLFNQTQQRATREQLARQITEKIRASRDIEAALQVAAAELSSALGTSRAVIDLQISESNEPTPQAANGKQN
jgi:GAF domain-containing protein